MTSKEQPDVGALKRAAATLQREEQKVTGNSETSAGGPGNCSIQFILIRILFFVCNQPPRCPWKMR